MCGSSDGVTSSGGGSLEGMHNCRGDMFDYKDPRHNNSRINEYNLVFLSRSRGGITSKKVRSKGTQFISSSVYQYHFVDEMWNVILSQRKIFLFPCSQAA